MFLGKLNFVGIISCRQTRKALMKVKTLDNITESIPSARRCVFLGFDRSGAFLLSYSSTPDSAADFRAQLQFWHIAANTPLRLLTTYPLFFGVGVRRSIVDADESEQAMLRERPSLDLQIWQNRECPEVLAIVGRLGFDNESRSLMRVTLCPLPLSQTSLATPAHAIIHFIYRVHEPYPLANGDHLVCSDDGDEGVGYGNYVMAFNTADSIMIIRFSMLPQEQNRLVLDQQHQPSVTTTIQPEEQAGTIPSPSESPTVPTNPAEWWTFDVFEGCVTVNQNPQSTLETGDSPTHAVPSTATQPAQLVLPLGSCVTWQRKFDAEIYLVKFMNPSFMVSTYDLRIVRVFSDRVIVLLVAVVQHRTTTSRFLVEHVLSVAYKTGETTPLFSNQQKLAQYHLQPQADQLVRAFSSRMMNLITSVDDIHIKAVSLSNRALLDGYSLPVIPNPVVPFAIYHKAQ
jgi:hypothetical protein